MFVCCWYFFGLWWRFPPSTLKFYSSTQWSCTGPGSLWEMPDSNTGSLTPRSVARYHWTTLSPTGQKFLYLLWFSIFLGPGPGHWNHIGSCSDTRIHIFFVFSLKRLCFELSIFNILKVPASFKKVFKNSSSQLHLALFKMYFRCYILLLKSMLFPLLS